MFKNMDEKAFLNSLQMQKNILWQTLKMMQRCKAYSEKNS